MQHRTEIQILKPAFGFQKSTQNLRTHSGTNSWCRSEAWFLGIFLDSPGGLKFRSRVIKNTFAFRQSDIQTFRHSDTQTLIHSDTQTFRHSDTQILRHSDTREDTQQTHGAHRHSDTQTLRQSDIRTLRHSDDAGPVVLTSGDGQCCWPAVLATIADQCCWPAVLASITVLLASGAGQYCWLVVLARTVRLHPLRPKVGPEGGPSFWAVVFWLTQKTQSSSAQSSSLSSALF
jgi:hypothetical protein